MTIKHFFRLHSVPLLFPLLVLIGAIMLADYFVPSEQTTEEKATTFEAVVVSEPTEKPKTMAMDLRTTADGRLLKCWLRKNEQSRQVMLGDRLRISARVTPRREWK